MEFGKLLLKYPWIVSDCIQGNIKQIGSFFELEKVYLLSGHFALLLLIRLIACVKIPSLNNILSLIAAAS